MTKKSQPKIPELVDSLLKEMEVFKNDMSEHSKSLENSISKINDIKVIFDLDRFERIKKSHNDELMNSWKKLEEQLTKSNKPPLDQIKRGRSVKYSYLILLNIILIFALGLSLYTIGAK